MRDCFYGLSISALEHHFRLEGVPVVHARALFKAAYRRFDPTPWRQARLPRSIQEKGGYWWTTNPFASINAQVSRYDSTTKFVVTLQDGNQVEMVLIPEKARITLCISSQVGCRQGCVFCHTGRMGLVRNLSAGEIVGQVVAANRWIAENPNWLSQIKGREGASVSNIVFMGMGEPLDNVDAIIGSLEILTDPQGLGIAQRRISVSTAGHLEGLSKLRAAFPRIPLAISLHQANDRKRSQIMPINRRWSLAEVVAAIKDINSSSGNAVLVQYTVINGINDHESDADSLVELLNGTNVKVNLIPLNEVEPSRLGAPTPERLQAFRDRIHKSGVRVMIRYSKGQDIAAACGQLVRMQPT